MHIHRHISSGQKAQSCEYRNSAMREVKKIFQSKIKKLRALMKDVK